MLSLLWRAATKPALSALLPLAFKSCQLVSSDFLPLLPSACLPAYVEVAAAFATQQTHLNTSLTAVGLQWTISDNIFSPAARVARGTDDDDDDDGDDDDGSDGAVDTADVAYDGACEGPVELESGDGVAPSPLSNSTGPSHAPS